MTTALTFPSFAPTGPYSIIPSLPLINLTDSERSLMSEIQNRFWQRRGQMELWDAYYRGEQLITNLRIAIPPQLESIRTLVGWGKVPVDPTVIRLAVDGFRLPGETNVDTALGDIWTDNQMGSEEKVLYTDLFAMSQGWLTVGSPYDDSDSPRICAQSPLNIAALYDPYTRKPRAALEWYWLDNAWNATFYVSANETIYLRQDVNRAWQLVDRDRHNFGVMPVVRLANEARSTARDGVSEITLPMMTTIDQACRTLLGMEISREFYSVPQKIILGATEADFKSADGTPKSAWDTYINRVLALTRDDDGNLPEVKQTAAFDPSVFTKIIAELASQFSGMANAIPQELGIYTQGNPVSSDGYDASEARRDRLARHKQRMIAPRLAEAMQIAIRFQNGGDLPDRYRRLEVDWEDMSRPAAMNADGIAKLVTEGIWVAESDVTLKATGLSAVQRAQMQQDRKASPSQQLLNAVASSQAAKLIHTEDTVAKDEPGAPAPTAAPAAGA